MFCPFLSWYYDNRSKTALFPVLHGKSIVITIIHLNPFLYALDTKMPFPGNILKIQSFLRYPGTIIFNHEFNVGMTHQHPHRDMAEAVQLFYTVINAVFNDWLQKQLQAAARTDLPGTVHRKGEFVHIADLHDIDICLRQLQLLCNGDDQITAA